MKHAREQALPSGSGLPLIARRVRQWQFTANDQGQLRQAAIRAAARFLRARRDELPEGCVPASQARLALLALEVHEVFLPRARGSVLRLRTPQLEAVAAAIEQANARAGS